MKKPQTAPRVDWKAQKIAIADLKTDLGTQLRASTDKATIDDYAAAMKDRQAFPPIDVFQLDDGTLVIADGFHRVAAAAAAGIKNMACRVRKGTLRDAKLHAAGANTSHGLRRTSADKRRTVVMLLEDEEWGQWSNREIARRAGVDETTVRRYRDEVTAAKPQSERTYTTKHGTDATMNTANIGMHGGSVTAEIPQLEPDGRYLEFDEILVGVNTLLSAFVDSGQHQNLAVMCVFPDQPQTVVTFTPVAHRPEFDDEHYNFVRVTDVGEISDEDREKGVTNEFYTPRGVNTRYAALFLKHATDENGKPFPGWHLRARPSGLLFVTPCEPAASIDELVSRRSWIGETLDAERIDATTAHYGTIPCGANLNALIYFSDAFRNQGNPALFRHEGESVDDYCRRMLGAPATAA